MMLQTTQRLTKIFKKGCDRLARFEMLAGEHVVPLLCFAALSIVVSWPLARNFTSLMVGDYQSGDVLQNLWLLWHTKEWLLGSDSLFYTSLLYYPAGLSMLVNGVGPVRGMMGLLFSPLGPIATYNGSVLLGLWFTGYCMYLLARGLNFPPGIALLSGVTLLIAPIHLAGMHGHLEKTFLGLPPLALLALHHALNPRRSARWAIVVGFLALLTLLHSGYQFIYTVLALGFFAAALLLRADPSERLTIIRRIAYVAASALVFVVPFVIAIQRASATVKADVYLESWRYQPDLIQLFLPNAENPIFGSLTTAALQTYRETATIETAVSLFWTSIVLCGAAWASRNRAARPWLLFSLLCIVFALGPSLKMFGRSTFTRYDLPIMLPYAVLAELPGLDFMRVSGRFILIAYVGLSVGAGFGLLWLTQRWPKRQRLILSVAAVLLLVEGWPRPWPQFPLPRVPAFYQALAADHERYGVFDVPFDGTDRNQREGLAMFYQMTHRKGIMGGYLSRSPAQHPFLPDLQTFDSPPDILVDSKPINPFANAQFELASYNYRYVVRHKDVLDDRAGTAFITAIFGQQMPIIDDDQVSVYPVSPHNGTTGQTTITASHGPGWYVYDPKWGGTWAGSPAELVIYSRIWQPVRLKISPLLFYDPKAANGLGLSGVIRVAADGNEPQRFSAQAGRPFDVEMPLRPGWNRITLASEAGSFRPKDVQPGNGDSRLLSFGLAPIDIIHESAPASDRR